MDILKIHNEKGRLFFILLLMLSCQNGDKMNFHKTNQNKQSIELGSDFVLASPNGLLPGTKMDNLTFYAEIVVIEDFKFVNDIENLIKDNECVNRRVDLILDYTDKSGYLLLSQTAIKNKIHHYKKENKGLYVTFLNNNPFFILFSYDDTPNLPLRKTGYRVDLSEYIDNYILVAHHFSYWFLAKKEGGGVEIIKEMLIGCDKK